MAIVNPHGRSPARRRGAAADRYEHRGWWFFLMLIAAASLVAATAAHAAPAKCIDAVRQAENDARLGIQGGAPDAVNARQEAKVHLYIAAMAADQGNEEQCWRQYHWAMVSRLP